MVFDYELLEYFLAAGVLVSAMLAMGAAHTAGDFLAIARAPQAIVLVLVIQLIVGPLSVLLLAKLFALPTAVLVGMLLITALPGGSYSNLLTYLGRGNVALSVAATTVCTILSLVTTPLILKSFGAEWFPSEIRMPVARICLEIAGWLLAPLTVGLLIRRIWPASSGAVERLFIRVSVALLIGLVAVSLQGGHVRWQIGWRAHVCVILSPIVWLWVTYGIAIVCRYSLTDAFTMAIEVVVRNCGLGLLLTASLFPPGSAHGAAIGQSVLYVVLLYSAVSFVVALSEVLARRKGVGLIYGRQQKDG